METPMSLYFIVGFLTVGNISVIITVLTFIFKAGSFVAETRSGISDAKDTAIRAHKRIDKLEEQPS